MIIHDYTMICIYICEYRKVWKMHHHDTQIPNKPPVFPPRLAAVAAEAASFA